ncbi:MAG: hypothetical protein WA947_05020 [Phormidesmis sp.]
MITLTAPDASAPVVSPATRSAAPPSLPTSPASTEPSRVRHMLFGTPTTVQTTIRHLHKLGYADPNDWSKPVSTGRRNEVMAILTKRVR